jgi:hypothetical protein
MIQFEKPFYKIVYLNIMEPLLVYPENAQQLEAIKDFLSAAKISFKSQSKAFPEHVAEGIEKSIQQHRNGQTISLQEFKDKYLSE